MRIISAVYLCLLAGTVTLLVFTGPVGAQGEKWAIVVGVGDYEDGNINDLPYAPEDAKEIYGLLREGGEFEEEHLLLMVDDSPEETQPTRSNILLKLSTWLQPVREGDTVLFYFSGHGIADAERGYLVPMTARMAVIREESIRLDTVMGYLRASGGGKILVLLDACHSGMAKVGAPTGAMGEGFEKSVSLEGATEREAEGEVVLASCQPNEYSYPYDPDRPFSLDNRSLFTHFVLEGLRGGADSPPSDRVITVSELNQFVYDGVTSRAAEIGVVQKPMIKVSGAGAITELPLLNVPLLVDGRLSLISMPPGARIYVDGEDRGITPIEVALAPGEHTLRLELDGFKAEERVVSLVAGESVDLGEIILDPLPFGSIAVNASPWAKVFLDGEEVGLTPLTIEDVAAGSHTIRLEYEGEIFEKRVKVKEGETENVSHSF